MSQQVSGQVSGQVGQIGRDGRGGGTGEQQMELAGSGAPDPEGARDSASFVAAMQDLKDWSGLTYRELTSRAEVAGDVLPRSTVANMLARTTLPREELVAAFVRACGVGPGETDAWLRVRKDLTRRERPEPADAVEVASRPEPQERAEPEPQPEPSPRGPRRRLVAAAVAALVVGVAAAAAVVLTGGDADDGAQPRAVTGPSPGPVQIRLVHSGLCLAEQGGRNGQLYQQPCSDRSVPEFSLKRLGADWRLETLHATFGWGCTGVQEKSTEIGAPVEDQECGKRGTAEAFRLEPVGTPVRGFRLRPLHSALCAGVEEATEREGEEIRQLACTDDGEGQLFSFDRRSAEGAGQ
ncbi:RICIN domain-containing protein [Streptomyces xantholiticus]